MCNHKLNLSTMTPNALCYNLDQMSKPDDTIPYSPNETHSPRSPPFSPSNLHPKAHDTHFPLHSLKKPGPRKPRKKLVSKPSHKENSGVLQSFAMVKKSSEPKKEFRESMMEMIEENNLMTLKDLEELLECYLSLNSKEYHSVIVEVFEEILVNLMLESI